MNPPHSPLQQMQDESHLRLLVIFHYLLGALELLGGVFLVIATILMMQVFQNMPAASGTSTSSATTPPVTTPSPPPATATSPPASTNPMSEEMADVITSMMGLVYGGWALLSIVLALLTLLSAYGISKKKWDVLSLITAGIQCLVFPIGTVLGVFTFIVLLRPSIAAQYRLNKSHPNSH